MALGPPFGAPGGKFCSVSGGVQAVRNAFSFLHPRICPPEPRIEGPEAKTWKICCWRVVSTGGMAAPMRGLCAMNGKWVKNGPKIAKNGDILVDFCDFGVIFGCEAKFWPIFALLGVERGSGTPPRGVRPYKSSEKSAKMGMHCAQRSQEHTHTISHQCFVQ